VTDELYRDAILTHYRAPKNRRNLVNADVTVSAADPLCGDEMTVSLRIVAGRIGDGAFEARGCSISQASADMMIDSARGSTIEEVKSLIAAFESMLRGEPSLEDHAVLGELQVLGGVRRFPSRLKCALLPWNALRSALERHVSSASAERAAS
jgi:nitrogen fixation NifU-like protein